MWPFSKSEKRASVETASVPLSSANIIQLFGISDSEAGVNVSYKTAMGVPAVWAAVNFISDAIAGLPLHLYQRSGVDRKRVDSYLSRIFHDAPNPGLTSFSWRKNLMTNALLRGRAYTYIERDQSNRIAALWHLDPDKTVVKSQAGKLVYEYNESASRKIEYSAQEIIDISWSVQPDGFSHWDPIAQNKNAIGLMIALEAYASKFFQNGGVPPLSLEGPIETAPGAKRASDSITQALADARKDKRNVIVMPSGHVLKAIGIDPEKMQMTDARRFQVEEIARIFSLPPVFLQDLTRGTFSNTEQQDLHFVKHTLKSWIERLEQEINLKLFPGTNTRFVEFNVDGLLRGDFKTRMDGYAKAVQNAHMTPNEVRRRENLPDMENGDDLLIQGATVPLGRQPMETPDGG